MPHGGFCAISDRQHRGGPAPPQQGQESSSNQTGRRRVPGSPRGTHDTCRLPALSGVTPETASPPEHQRLRTPAPRTRPVRPVSGAANALANHGARPHGARSRQGGRLRARKSARQEGEDLMRPGDAPEEGTAGQTPERRDRPPGPCRAEQEVSGRMHSMGTPDLRTPQTEGHKLILLPPNYCSLFQ